MKKLTDQQIIASWHKNVRPWIAAVGNGEIESRLLVTNKAIIDAVLSRAPQTLLDVGCGEGWLVREMSKRGIEALGIDVVPEFIEFAQKAGAGRFKALAYEDVSLDTLNAHFDVVVCNFSLLGHESVKHLFQQVPALLNEGGALIVQTIHPLVGCGDEPYVDGWRQGSWAGFSNRFSDPAPWYFRTIESWQALFQENGFDRVDVLEPMNPKIQLPASIIFIGEPAN